MWAVSHFRKNPLEGNGLESRKSEAEKQVTGRVTRPDMKEPDYSRMWGHCGLEVRADTARCVLVSYNRDSREGKVEDTWETKCTVIPVTQEELLEKDNTFHFREFSFTGSTTTHARCLYMNL